MGTMTLLLAHQGGWDEVLIVMAPIAVFGGLLFMANRRAAALEDGAPDEGDDAESPVGEG